LEFDNIIRLLHPIAEGCSHICLPEGIMIFKNLSSVGSEVQYEPRLVGDIITEMFLGNSPLAKGYRKHLASIENSAEKGGEL
jgi:hypothetical protein